MIVHLMLDSVYTNNFIRTLIEQKRINENKVLLVYYETDVKYIDYEVKKNIIQVRRKPGIFKRSEEYEILCDNIGTDDEVYIHYLGTEFVWTVIGTKARQYNWILWGGDFYPYCNVELYDNETKEILGKIHNYEENTVKVKVKEYISLQLRKKAIKKIDYMLTWNNYDYELVRKQFSIKAKLKYFMYPKVNDYKVLDEISNAKIHNEDELVIQIGNSGSYTNNHISILRKLKKYKNENKLKIIAPLSYGDKVYIDDVIKEGKEIFGDKFQPITQHNPLEEYYNLLNRVDIAIMNHHRQEGAGNIITLLYLGKKVYFNKQVTTYKTFKEWGFNIYNIEDIKESTFDDLFKIRKEEIAVNKRIIKEKFNDDAMF